MATITRGQVSTFNSAGPPVASISTTFSVAPTAGQSVLVFIQCGAAFGVQMGVPTGVVDNGSPSRAFYEVAHAGAKPNILSSFYRGAYIYRADNVQPSGTYTVTAFQDLTQSMGIGAVSYSNLGSLAGWQYGQSTLGILTDTVGYTGPLVAPKPSASVLFFGGFSNNSGANPETQTLNSAAFTGRGSNTDGASAVCCGLADAITSDGVAQNLQWTFGDAVVWTVILAAFHSSDSSTSDELILPNQHLRPRIYAPGIAR